MELLLTDVASIFIIGLVLFASAFALFVPLYFYLKSPKLALRVCIPISLSFEILVAYLFYTFSLIGVFPLIYLIFVLALNIYYGIKLKLFHEVKKLKFRFEVKSFLLVFFSAASVVFTRFYDAVRNVAPGAIDASAHAQYVLDLSTSGRLSSVYYAPGFHLLVYPASRIVNMIDVYRFTGPILGLLALLSLYFLLKEFLGNKTSKYFLFLVFGLPIISILTLETISFFPTALTFIFLPMLLYVLIRPKEFSEQTILIFCGMVVAGIALTVPYFLVQFVPAVVLLAILTAIILKQIGKKYLVFLIKIIAISIFGFVLAFGHVYLQNKISKKDTTNGFPQIAIAKENNQDKSSDLAPATNVEKTTEYLEKHEEIQKTFGESVIFKNYILPMMMTGGDVISVKNIRPLTSLMSVMAYFWIIVALALVYFGAKKRNRIFLTFGAFILAFGVATQTGILEMTTYRGRSGWYLILLAVVVSIYFLDKIIARFPKLIIYFALIVLLLTTFLFPPTFYRGFYSDYFTEGLAIAREFPNQKILIAADEPRILIISNNFVFDEFTSDSVGSTCDFDQCFIIFENKFFDIDPIKSQSTLSGESDRKKFAESQEVERVNHEKIVEAIKNSPNFTAYELYFQNDFISAYRFIK